ncbi:MAG: sugar phosphate isomerase/epimerase [Armatimonadetes bacterium]|nr:sugar phosphate isomerase/epimerase [Armatimonadota bacterium]
MKPGLGSYTFTWAVGVPGFAPDRPMDAFALLEAAARLEAKAVQFCDNLPLSGLPEPELRALRAEADSMGIAVEVGTRGLDPENLRAYLRLAAPFGCPFVRLVIDRPGDEPSPEEALARLRPILPDFARAGVKLAVENHDRFPASVLARLVESLGADRAGVCLDTVNSFGCLEGLEAAIPILAPYTLNLHVKDFILRRMSHQMGFIIEGCPAGQGRLDIPRLLEQLAAAGKSEISAVLELWTPPEATLEETIRKERRWAEESMAYLQGAVRG